MSLKHLVEKLAAYEPQATVLGLYLNAKTNRISPTRKQVLTPAERVGP